MLVLASASKARKKLLEQICLKHKVIVSDFDETKVVEQDPRLKVKLLAKAKANSVLRKLKKENKESNSISKVNSVNSVNSASKVKETNTNDDK